MISQYERQYLNIVEDILNNGYKDVNRTGVDTLKTPHKMISIDLEKEFPILQSKFVAFKTAVKELLWIYKDQSNSVERLREQNVNIWNEWEMEDGTIGESYGWVVKKYNQIDKLIEGLKNDPQGRRHIMSLWQIPHLDKGALYPCCFMTMWDVTDGRLNCMLVQRSADVPLGLPFNTTQYAVLTHLIAKVTGLKPGILTHVINNAHIYENQIDGMKEQLKRYNNAKDIILKPVNELTVSDMVYINAFGTKPKIEIDNVNSFYDFDIDKIRLVGYKHMGMIKMPVSV